MCCSTAVNLPDDSDSRLNPNVKSVPSRKKQPSFELGGIESLQETTQVYKIKCYYFGEKEVAIGKKADEKVLQKQKLIRRASGKYNPEIVLKFATDLRKVVDGERENWYDDVDGVLAIIILLQFFTKIMYPDDSRAYRFDEEVIELSKYIVQNPEYVALYTDYQLLLVVSPLAYSENVYDNEMAQELIQQRI